MSSSSSSPSPFPVSLSEWLKEPSHEFPCLLTKEFYFSQEEAKEKLKKLGIVFMEQVLHMAFTFQSQACQTEPQTSLKEDIWFQMALESHPWYIYFKNLKLATSTQSLQEFQTLVNQQNIKPEPPTPSKNTQTIYFAPNQLRIPSQLVNTSEAKPKQFVLPSQRGAAFL